MNKKLSFKSQLQWPKEAGFPPDVSYLEELLRLNGDLAVRRELNEFIGFLRLRELEQHAEEMRKSGKGDSLLGGKELGQAE